MNSTEIKPKTWENGEILPEQINKILENAFDLANSDGAFHNNLVDATKVEDGIVLIELKPSFPPFDEKFLLELSSFSKDRFSIQVSCWQNSNRKLFITKRSVL